MVDLRIDKSARSLEEGSWVGGIHSRLIESILCLSESTGILDVGLVEVDGLAAERWPADGFVVVNIDELDTVLVGYDGVVVAFGPLDLCVDKEHFS